MLVSLFCVSCLAGFLTDTSSWHLAAIPLWAQGCAKSTERDTKPYTIEGISCGLQSDIFAFWEGVAVKPNCVNRLPPSRKVFAHGRDKAASKKRTGTRSVFLKAALQKKHTQSLTSPVDPHLRRERPQMRVNRGKAAPGGAHSALNLAIPTTHYD